MKELHFNNLRIKVNYERTNNVYSQVQLGSPENCSCTNCLNFSRNRSAIYPQEFKGLLKELGISYDKECEIYHNYKMKNGKHNYGGWFHFTGSVYIKNKPYLDYIEMDDRTDTISINENFQFFFTKDSSLNYFRKDEEKELIQIEFIANSDWVLNKELESE